MSPDMIQIISAAFVSILTTGGIAYLWMEGINKRREIKIEAEAKQKEAEFQLKLQELANAHQLKLKEVEQDANQARTQAETMKYAHEREVERLKADKDKEITRIRAQSDQEMNQAGTMRQLIEYLDKNSHQNGELYSNLAQVLQRLTETTQGQGERNFTAYTQLSNRLTTLDISINEMPKKIASHMTRANREAIRNDMQEIMNEHERNAQGRTITILEKYEQTEKRITRLEEFVKLPPIEESA